MAWPPEARQLVQWPAGLALLLDLLLDSHHFGWKSKGKKQIEEHNQLGPVYKSSTKAFSP